MIINSCNQPTNVSNHLIMYILLMIVNQTSKITKNIFPYIIYTYILYILYYIYIYIYIYILCIH